MNDKIDLNFGTIFNCGYWGELPETICDKDFIIESVIGRGLEGVQKDVIDYLYNNLNYNKEWEKIASDNCINVIQDILDEDKSIKDVKIVSAEPYSNGYIGCGIEFTLNKEVDEEEVEKFINNKFINSAGNALEDIIEKLQETLDRAYHSVTKQDMEKMYDKLNMKFSVPDSERPDSLEDFLDNFKYGSDGIYHFKNEKQSELFKATSSSESNNKIVKSIIENAEGGILNGYSSYCVMSEFWIDKCRYVIHAYKYTDEDYLNNKKWNQNKMKEYLKSNDFEDIKVKCNYGSNKGDTFTLAEIIGKEINGKFKSFIYDGKKITASSRKEAISKIIASSYSSDTLTFFENMDFNFASNGKLDKELLTEEILTWLENDESLYNRISNGRIKAHSLVWEALYNYIKTNVVNRNFYLTSDKIKNWFKHLGTDYISGLSDAVKAVQKLKDETKKGK